jgi:hypothetical protein
MSPASIRKSVKETTTVSDFDNVSIDLRWFQEDEVDSGGILEIIRRTDDENTFVHYVEDSVMGVKYIFFEGKNASKEFKAAENEFDFYAWGDLIEQFKNSVDLPPKIHSIYNLSVLTSSEYDKSQMEFFTDLVFKDPDEQVRLAGIAGISYVDWAQFQNLLKDLEKNDESQAVRNSARKMLESYAATGSENK